MTVSKHARAEARANAVRNIMFALAPSRRTIIRRQADDVGTFVPLTMTGRRARKAPQAGSSTRRWAPYRLSPSRPRPTRNGRRSSPIPTRSSSAPNYRRRRGGRAAPRPRRRRARTSASPATGRSASRPPRAPWPTSTTAISGAARASLNAPIEAGGASAAPFLGWPTNRSCKRPAQNWRMVREARRR